LYTACLRCYSYTAGHTLDLVISNSGNTINNVAVGDFLSDHAIVEFDINVSKPMSYQSTWTECCQWKKLSFPAFESDLCKAKL